MVETDFDKFVASSKNDTPWEIKDLRLSAYPYFDIISKESHLAMTFTAEVNHGGVAPHAVTVSYRETESGADFGVWCGDKFQEVGGLTETDAEKRANEALNAASLKSPQAFKAMMSRFSSRPASDNCSFWLDWRKNKKLCEHTQAMLHHLRTNVPDFKEQLATQYQALLGGVSAPVEIGDILSLSELAFQVPVLVEGDRGAGKTHEARAFARQNSFPLIEFGGHESVESLDLLGYQVQAPNGQMVWKDGPLTEAYRRAQKGHVVLLLDELLRIPTRQLSILLTALSPDNGKYRLRTGRIVDVVDGVAQEETLECPTENLCVIATTNVGSEYAVDEIDPAIAERFVPLHKSSTEAQLRKILTDLCTKKGFAAATVNKALKFFSKMADAKNSGLVARTPTTRTMVRSFELAKSVKDIKRVLKTQAMLWVERTTEGVPVPEQLTTVNELIDTIFK